MSWARNRLNMRFYDRIGFFRFLGYLALSTGRGPARLSMCWSLHHLVCGKPVHFFIQFHFQTPYQHNSAA